MEPVEARVTRRTPVDGEAIPVPHFGLVLPMQEWRRVIARLEAAGQVWVVPPAVRFAGQAGEQATAFLADPAGNVIELKAMAEPGNLFAREPR